MDYTEYVSLKKKFKDEYEKKLEALEIIWEAISKNTPSVNGQSMPELQETPTNKKGWARKALYLIRDAEITQPKVMDKLLEIAPELKGLDIGIINKVLREETKNENLELVETFAGQIPNIYRWKKKKN